MSTSWRVPNQMQNEAENNLSAGMGFRLGEFHQEGKKQFLNETLGAPKPIMCLTKTLGPKQLDLVVSPQLGSMGRGPKSRHLNASNESSSLGNPSCFAQRRQQIGDFCPGGFLSRRLGSYPSARPLYIYIYIYSILVHAL